MKQLEMHFNYNQKLFNNCFSFVHEHDAEKFFLNNQFEILLEGKLLGVVKVEAVRTLAFKQITDVLSYIDTGRSVQTYAAILKQRFDDMQADTLLDHVVVSYVTRTDYLVQLMEQGVQANKFLIQLNQ